MPLSEHVYCVAMAFEMTERVEQQICIKFFIKLEHFSVKTIWMIQKAFGDDTMSTAKKKKKCGTNASKTVENLLKVVHVLEGLQHAEHLRMLNM